jgi:NNP family nitrate/nitrite transporter-like MFS transporter
MAVKSGIPAFWSFLIFYSVCSAVTYVFFLRPASAPRTVARGLRLAYAGV